MFHDSQVATANSRLRGFCWLRGKGPGTGSGHGVKSQSPGFGDGDGNCTGTQQASLGSSLDPLCRVKCASTASAALLPRLGYMVLPRTHGSAGFAGRRPPSPGTFDPKSGSMWFLLSPESTFPTNELDCLLICNSRSKAMIASSCHAPTFMPKDDGTVSARSNREVTQS